MNFGTKMQKTNQRTKDWTNECKIDLKQSAKSGSVIKKIILEMHFSLKTPEWQSKNASISILKPKNIFPEKTLIILCKKSNKINSLKN